MQRFIIAIVTMLFGKCFAAACTPIPNVEYDKLAPYARILFGEIHGTVEAPSLFSSVACVASKRHDRVTIAIEWPSDMRDGLLEYLRDSTPGKTLPNWRFLSFSEDGRTSIAMLKALVDLSDEINSGKIRLVLLDKPTTLAPRAGLRGLTRDQHMWEILREEISQNRPEKLLALVGNYHIFRSPGMDGKPRLGGLTDDFLILNVQTSGGKAWTCVDDCGPHELKGAVQGSFGKIMLFGRPSEVDGLFQTGRTNASPPIRQH